jgi:hypothetical protein
MQRYVPSPLETQSKDRKSCTQARWSRVGLLRDKDSERMDDAWRDKYLTVIDHLPFIAKILKMSNLVRCGLVSAQQAPRDSLAGMIEREYKIRYVTREMRHISGFCTPSAL